jgi:GNAT superfamily N-acetyltransferase
MKRHQHWREVWKITFDSITLKDRISRSNIDLPETLSEELRQAIKNVKKFAGHIRVRRISSDNDLESVLKIRLRAYQKANKVDSSLSWQDMQDEYDKNSIIFAAYVGNTIAATVRFVFRKADRKLPLEKYFEIEPLLGKIGNNETCIEISRFAVDPHFQGTDLMVAILRQVAVELVAKKIGISLCMATNDLAPYYEVIGAKKISGPIRHPVLDSEVLTLFKFDNDAVLTGNISPVGWYFVIKPAIQFLFKHGMAKKVGIGIKKIFLLPFSILIMKIQSKMKRRKQR